MKIIGEFKAFAMKGNVTDMAIGIVIGAAFGKIVTSFVNDILMPPIGLLIGGVDFSELVVVMKKAVGEVPAVTLNYGLFFQNAINFLIIASVIFIVVRTVNMARRKEEEAPPVPPAPSREEVLLAEIRDLLKK